MLLNYLKLAVRLLTRNPFLTFINVVGLSLGFAAFYALWEFSTSELKTDQHHKDFERIARIGMNWTWSDDGGKSWGHIVVGSPMTSQFYKVVDDYPEVEDAVSVMQQQNFSKEATGHGTETLISFDEPGKNARVFKEEHLVYADSNLFSFFNIPLVYGEKEEVLSEAGFVVLSRSTAKKYFGETDPRRQILKLNDSLSLKVSGVFEDLPHYTHLKFDLVISNKNLVNRWKTFPEIFSHWYLKLSKGSDLKSFESKLNTEVPNYCADQLRAFPQAKLYFFVQPLKDVQFGQPLMADNFYPKSKTFLYTLAFIAVSILFMAQVNYVNLTLTHTMRRLKEVATRKVSGAGILDIVMQFVMEAFIVTIIALALSFTLIQLVRTPVALLFNIQIAPIAAISFSTQLILFLIIATGVLLSGLYPALVFFSYHPGVLFRLSKTPSNKRIIPSLLTISQFSAALVFILFGFVVAHQLSYILNKEVGITKEEIIIIEGPVVKTGNFHQDFHSFSKQLSKYPNVQGVTVSNSVVGDKAYSSGYLKVVGADLFFGMENFGVDEYFIPFYSVKLLAGRNFVLDDRADVVLISRVAANRLGFDKPEKAIGAIVHTDYAQGLNRNWRKVEVIGVIEDFRLVSFFNLKEASSEFASEGRGIFLAYENKLFDALGAQKIGLKVNKQNLESVIADVEELFNKQFPGNSFTWYFLDDHVNGVYGYEKIARNQILLFTGLAIVIACMGLLGMISYKAVEKTKEIGIRKTLGAKGIHIGTLLLNTTLKHILISIFIGIPISWYLIQRYFEKFSDHVVLQWWHYLVPVLILILIMFITIASVLWKAARTNPVDALKYE